MKDCCKKCLLAECKWDSKFVFVQEDTCAWSRSEFVSLPRSKQISILKESRGCVFSRAEPRHKQVRPRLPFCRWSPGTSRCGRGCPRAGGAQAQAGAAEVACSGMVEFRCQHKGAVGQSQGTSIWAGRLRLQVWLDRAKATVKCSEAQPRHKHKRKKAEVTRVVGQNRGTSIRAEGQSQGTSISAVGQSQRTSISAVGQKAEVASVVGQSQGNSPSVVRSTLQAYFWAEPRHKHQHSRAEPKHPCALASVSSIPLCFVAVTTAGHRAPAQGAGRVHGHDHLLSLNFLGFIAVPTAGHRAPAQGAGRAHGHDHVLSLNFLGSVAVPTAGH
eukprot:1145112-Pelagomonas_calceolata.AAC.21